MSVLQVANLHFNSVGSERIELIGGNVKVFTAGGFITETSRSSVFNGSTAEPLVRITQTGTGEAFRVEDETNPDSSPFVVTANGDVGIGTNNIFYQTNWTTLALGGQKNGEFLLNFNNGNAAGFLTVFKSALPGNDSHGMYFYDSLVNQLWSIDYYGSNDSEGLRFETRNANSAFTFRPNNITRVTFDTSGNVLIGRTNSTVGQNVKLDVNGAINTSSILVNGTAPFTTLLANTSVGTGTTYVINNTVITKPYKKIEIWFNTVSHNAGANRGLQIEWSVNNGTTILGPVSLGSSIAATDFWSGVANWVNADDTTASAIRQYFVTGGTTSAAYTFTASQTTTVASYINWFRISLSGGAGNLDNGTLNVYGYQ